MLFGIIGCPGGYKGGNHVNITQQRKTLSSQLTPLNSLPIPCGIRTPPGPRGPEGYRGAPMKGCKERQAKLSTNDLTNIVSLLTGKKFDPIGPPGPMPSFGGICPSGLGAGPALCPIPFTP